MIDMKRLLLLFFSLCTFFFIRAQVLTLEEAIATALKNNYNIQLARLDSTSAALNNSYAYAAFIPQLNGILSKTWNNNAQKVELQNGTKRDASGLRSNNLNAAVNLNWTLFDGLRMFAAKEKLQQIQELGGLNVRNEVTNTVANLMTTYYNIVQQKQQLKAIEEQMTISSERVALAERKLSVGLGTKQELLQAQLDLNAQKAAQLQQQTAIEQLKQQLNQLMSVEEKAFYDVLDSIPINTSITLEDVLTSAENFNPSLQIAKKNIDIANLTIRETKADFFPTISFNSAYNFTRLNNSAVVNPASPLFSQNKGFNYGFLANIPILNNFNTRRLLQQARLSLRSTELRLSSQRLQVDIGVYNAFRSYQFHKQA